MDSAKPGKDAKGKKAGPGQHGKGGRGVRIAPHESGEGSRAHFHPEVSADLKGDADYKHHVTEHAKHVAGYLTHKAHDPERAEAHRQAANLHARVGNALHAGGDTKPAPPPPMFFGPPGAAGGGKAGPGSPGPDALGRPLPGAPDGKRNPPGRDSQLESQRSAGKAPGGTAGAKGGQPKPGQQPPMQLVGKSLYFDLSKAGGPFIGPRGGKWADAQHTIPWHDIELAVRGSKGELVPTKASAHARHGEWAAHAPVGSAEQEARDAAIRALPDKIEGYELEGSRRVIGGGMFAQKWKHGGWLKFVPKLGGASIAAEGFHVTAHKSAKAAGVEPDTYNVTHVPTGLSVKRGMTKEEAASLARHLHEHAGDSFPGLKLGDVPNHKNAAHAAELKRVKTALDAWDESQHQKALAKPPPKPRKRSKRDQAAFDKYAAWDASKKQIEAEEAGWDEGTKAAEKAAEGKVLDEVRKVRGHVMRVGADGMKHVYNLNRTVPKKDSPHEYESETLASGRTWREVLANMQESKKSFTTLPLGAQRIPLLLVLTKSGGPYIGPRGGKWADPQHTVPWEEPNPAEGKAGGASAHAGGKAMAKTEFSSSEAAVAAHYGMSLARYNEIAQFRPQPVGPIDQRWRDLTDRESTAFTAIERASKTYGPTKASRAATRARKARRAMLDKLAAARDEDARALSTDADLAR